MTHPIDTGDGSRHPIAQAVAVIDARLDAVVDAPAWSLDRTQTDQLLSQVTRTQARLEELQLRLLARARVVKTEDLDGSTSTATRHAVQTNTTRPVAHRASKLAAALDTDLHEPVRRALAAGDVLVDQAAVIIDAVQALPAEHVDDVLRADAQAHLLGEAKRFDAKHLRILGRRLLEVVAPQVAEAWEAEKLAAEEAEAEAAAVFRMSDDGHGKTHGRFTIPTPVADILRGYLRGFTAPRHRAAGGQDPLPAGTPSAHRDGLALIELITRYPVDRLPCAGGVAATMTVLLDYDTLTGGLKAAHLDTGTRISPGLARRWACEAGIVPAVLGGGSQVLDLGRTRRLHSPAQRTALAIEQGGCTAHGCDAPPGLCHVHHDTPWARGGTTDLANGRLLCPRHHTRAHDPTYTVTKLTSGKITYHRRT